MRFSLFCVFLALLACISTASRDDDELVYCSYAIEGMAGLGTDYCELIADSGSVPRVVVVKNKNCRFAEQVTDTFEVDDTVIASLRNMLNKKDLDAVAGYREEAGLEGGREYRFHIEYKSGRTIHASWHTHSPLPEAVDIFSTIRSFFAPWMDKKEKANAGVPD